MAVGERYANLFNTSDMAIDLVSAEDYAACHRLMRGASKNYSFATAFLPLEKRPHVEALYALLRVGDDRVDVSHEGFRSPEEAIDDWEVTYWRAFETGTSPHPVMRAYLNTALTFEIPAETMVAYFRAMKEDLTITRFPAFSDLLHYMDGSSIPVGRAMAYVLGVREPYTLAQAISHADNLAIAMQLSNFWRDIGQDWGIGRVYIPQEDLDRFEVSENDLAEGRINKNFIDLLEFEICRAEGYYTEARAGVDMLSAGRWGVLNGLAIYQAILRGIRLNSYNVFSQRAGTSNLEKVGLVLGAWWQIHGL
jgi:phytoene synthase